MVTVGAADVLGLPVGTTHRRAVLAVPGHALSDLAEPTLGPLRRDSEQADPRPRRSPHPHQQWSQRHVPSEEDPQKSTPGVDDAMQQFELHWLLAVHPQLQRLSAQ